MQLFRMVQVETLDTSSYTMGSNLRECVGLKVLHGSILKSTRRVHQRVNFQLIDSNWAPESVLIVDTPTKCLT